MQRILNHLGQWADKFGLDFCQDKTNFVVFSTSNRKLNLEELYLKGNLVKEMNHTKGLKYLGVTLDRKLSFKIHIDNKIKETKSKLGLAKQKIWAQHGTNCKWLKYAYSAVAIPTLTYAAHIWAHKISANHRRGLKDINRLACKLIAPQVGRSPLDGLEVILGIQPLDITVEAAAVNIYLNIEGKYDTFWAELTKRVNMWDSGEQWINMYHNTAR